MNNSTPGLIINNSSLIEQLKIKNKLLNAYDCLVNEQRKTIFNLHEIVELKENKINDLAFENVKLEYEKHKAHVVNIVLGSIVVLLTTLLFILL